MISENEILSTINMTRAEHLDVRTVTLGVSLFDCASTDYDTFAYRLRAKISKYAKRLVETCNMVGDRSRAISLPPSAASLTLPRRKSVSTLWAVSALSLRRASPPVSVT